MRLWGQTMVLVDRWQLSEAAPTIPIVCAEVHVIHIWLLFHHGAIFAATISFCENHISCLIKPYLLNKTCVSNIIAKSDIVQKVLIRVDVFSAKSMASTRYIWLGLPQWPPLMSKLVYRKFNSQPRMKSAFLAFPIPLILKPPFFHCIKHRIWWYGVSVHGIKCCTKWKKDCIMTRFGCWNVKYNLHLHSPKWYLWVQFTWPYIIFHDNFKFVYAIIILLYKKCILVDSVLSLKLFPTTRTHHFYFFLI